MDPRIKEAVRKISDNINPSTGLGHPRDMEKTARWIGEAIQELEKPEHPDDVANELFSLGKVGQSTSRDVGLIYEALWCFIKGSSPF